MESEHRFDVLVVGAGIGGLCAAARLAAGGRRTLLVERAERVGGRASTYEKDGFKLNTGAVAIEVGGTMEETAKELGVDLGLRFPDPANVFSIKGKLVNPSGGGWALLLNQMTKRGAKLLTSLGSARKGELPEEQLTLEAWLGRTTSNKTVHRLFRNLSAAVFAVNADEIPARAFLTYFMQKGAFRRFGFHPDGTIGVAAGFAEAAAREGAEIWLDSEALSLEVEGDRVTGATIRRDGSEIEVRCDAVVSDIGPVATIGLCGDESLPSEYLEQIRAGARPAANIIIHVASREPLLDAPGLVLFSETERVCNAGTLTVTCPELAPEGWHLTVVYAVPRPAIGDFDSEAELAASIEELRGLLPGMDDAQILDARVMRDGWPGQRAASGYEMPAETPLVNLLHVGDAVRDYADGGTQACAVTAKRAADQLLGDATPVAAV
ncbi:MAG: FAD-dependent oxidoreductase [Solirubrobacterales bacterium]